MHAWTLDAWTVDDRTFFSFGTGPVNPRWILNTATSEQACRFLGVPVEARPASTLPVELQRKGLLLEQTGPEEPLLKHALRCGVSLYTLELSRLCKDASVKVSRDAKGKLNKKCYMVALVRHYFPELSTADQDRMADYSNADVPDQDDDTSEMKAVLQHLDQSDLQWHEALEQEIQRKEAKDTVEKVQRAVRAAAKSRGKKRKHAEAEAEAQLRADLEKEASTRNAMKTPAALRERIPGAGQLRGCYLQERHGQYQGWYPGASPFKSRCCSYGAKRSKEDALELVLTWMWGWHERLTGGAPESSPGKRKLAVGKPKMRVRRKSQG